MDLKLRKSSIVLMRKIRNLGQLRGIVYFSSVTELKSFCEKVEQSTKMASCCFLDATVGSHFFDGQKEPSVSVKIK